MKLEIRNLTKAFGGVRAIDDVSLDFPSGSLSAVIGPNGAGKSTFFNLISGAFPPDQGEVLLDGQDIVRLSRSQRMHRGIGRAFQLFQRHLKRLKNQGLLLAVVSKNEERDVREMFEKHPEMVLRTEDIVAWRVNWKNKSQNLCELAEELKPAESVTLILA